jgi:hypothetical protein
MKLLQTKKQKEAELKSAASFSVLRRQLKYSIVGVGQDRTIVMKGRFIHYFKKHFGIISKVCADIGIDRTTYYSWRRDDKKFAAAIEAASVERNDSVEDVLFKLIDEGDGASVRFYLGRRNPLYTLKVINKVYTGERTLEDLLDEYQTEDENIARQPGVDRTTVQNQEQTRATSTVPTQSGPTILLGTQDAPEPDNQGKAEGPKQGD